MSVSSGSETITTGGVPFMVLVGLRVGSAAVQALTINATASAALSKRPGLKWQPP